MYNIVGICMYIELCMLIMRVYMTALVWHWDLRMAEDKT